MDILKRENESIEKEIRFLKKITNLPFLKLVKFVKNKVTYFINKTKRHQLTIKTTSY